MIRTIVRSVVAVIAWFAAVVLFVLSPAIGSISSIAALLLILLLSPTVFMRGSWGALRAQPATLLLAAAFVMLAVCFALTQTQPSDVLLVTAFLGLLLAPVAYLLAWRRPGARIIAVIAALFALGTFVGAVTASYDVFVQHFERAIGWGSGGNLMARSVVPLGFMALSGVFAVRSPWRWLYLLGPAFGLYALVLTQTRGVFIAVPVLSLIFIWALMREFRASRWWYLAGLGVLAVIVVAAAIYSPRLLGVTGVLEQVVADPSAVSDPGTAQRIAMWHAGWYAFLQHPLIGWGWARLSEAALPTVLSMYHNDFVNMAVAAGVAGIVSLLLVLAAPLLGVALMPRDRFSTLRLYCALILSVSFFIFGLTDLTFGYDLPTTLYAFMTAVVLGAFREKDPAVNPA